MNTQQNMSLPFTMNTSRDYNAHIPYHTHLHYEVYYFHSGKVKQAPLWMQRNGLEWLFRLKSQPRRLWRRYFVNVPLFLARIALQLSGVRKYPTC